MRCTSKQINFTQANATINWLYTATGQKVQKTVKDANNVVTNKHYIGNVQYVDTEVDFIQHQEGRIIRTLVGMDVSNNPIYDYRYEYSLKDHLGNERVFFSDMNKDGIVEVAQNGNANELLQQEHYYPFGMGIDGEWKYAQSQIGGVNKYQYNGIELNDDFGLNWNIAMFRTYDPSIGRWGQTDPLAQLFLNSSSYSGMGNNPISFSDPLGLAPTPPVDRKKKKSRPPSFGRIKVELPVMLRPIQISLGDVAVIAGGRIINRNGRFKSKDRAFSQFNLNIQNFGFNRFRTPTISGSRARPNMRLNLNFNGINNQQQQNTFNIQNIGVNIPFTSNNIISPFAGSYWPSSGGIDLRFNLNNANPGPLGQGGILITITPLLESSKRTRNFSFWTSNQLHGGSYKNDRFWNTPRGKMLQKVNARKMARAQIYVNGLPVGRIRTEAQASLQNIRYNEDVYSRLNPPPPGT